MSRLCRISESLHIRRHLLWKELGPIGINSSRTDTSLRRTQSALARTRFTSGLRRVDLFQSRIASGWAESACSRRPVALAHFDITLSRSDIASTQTDIEMTISNSLW